MQRGPLVLKATISLKHKLGQEDQAADITY